MKHFWCPRNGMWDFNSFLTRTIMTLIYILHASLVAERLTIWVYLWLFEGFLGVASEVTDSCLYSLIINISTFTYRRIWYRTSVWFIGYEIFWTTWTICWLEIWWLDWPNVAVVRCHITIGMPEFFLKIRV